MHFELRLYSVPCSLLAHHGPEGKPIYESICIQIQVENQKRYCMRKRVVLLSQKWAKRSPFCLFALSATESKEYCEGTGQSDFIHLLVNPQKVLVLSPDLNLSGTASQTPNTHSHITVQQGLIPVPNQNLALSYPSSGKLRGRFELPSCIWERDTQPVSISGEIHKWYQFITWCNKGHTSG